MTTTLHTLRRTAEARLRAAGVETPEMDARLLAEHALGLTRDQLFARADDPVPEAAATRFAALVERRAGREPVSRIIGSRGFWTLDLALTPATLDPRPDTETVVEAALDAVTDRSAPLRLLDLGTGTGCILLALLAELPAATGLGIDISADAVAAAAANAAANGLADRASFRTGDWDTGTAERFDLVVSNPPYIPGGDIAGLEPEVRRHDPLRALDGGPDGLDAYRAIVPRLPRLLVPGGTAALEVGAGQAADVAALLTGNGLSVTGIFRDLGGIERCVRGRNDR
ncbi:peptide chain release factor N(5)-glutamine methyltransferase [Azospirillum halopraeferens]|uniref:peptide chain release factor N(5)-glutamine methyltransferase n=1 Tax=Azospirillum halopraeferens TaxID=34010 RepID=UPI000404349F|nr:peptide chain release factor N(5)-glutamine methyltransferase [Azospirillum halopraeferens]